ncbi:MAG TPA: hypothetical protein VG294_13575 [Solirubrobacteraceae bacterium]|nr:hypothetical protein [Solirubrobacteraceae bacterium]
MLVKILAPRRQRLPVLVTRAALAVLLTPVILAAGLVAVVVMPAAILSRHIAARTVARRKRALAPVLQLEASPAESSVAL